MARTYEELDKVVNELVIDRDTDRGLIEDQNNQIADLKREVDEFEDRELPEHFHKNDKIEFKDLSGGIGVLNSTVSGVSEQGVMKVYTVGATSYFAVKVGDTWKKAQLSDV